MEVRGVRAEHQESTRQVTTADLEADRRIKLRHVRLFFFFSSRRRHTRCSRDWSSDVCSSDLYSTAIEAGPGHDCGGILFVLIISGGDKSAFRSLQRELARLELREFKMPILRRDRKSVV